MAERIVDFRVGSDAEFLCLDGYDEVVNSSSYDASYNSCFGADGNGVLFEARPEPSKNPLEVVYNIQDIFFRQIITNQKFNNFKWIAGSYYCGYPLGGHIHFGLKGKIGMGESSSYLDNYLGSISILLEKKNDGLYRRSSGYGRISDCRNQPYGFEYRTPSSWLVSPYISAAFLCLAKTIMFEVLNNKKFKFNTYVDSRNFYLMQTEFVLTKFSEIWRDITKMKLYQTYKPYLDILYFLVKNRLTWFPKHNMKTAWGVTKFNKLQILENNKIDLNTIWLNYSNETQTV